MRWDGGARSGSRPRRRFPANVVAFVVPGSDGAVLAELAEGALNGVALLIGGGVEGGRQAAPAAAFEPVLDLVAGSGMVALTARLRRWARIAALE